MIKFTQGPYPIYLSQHQIIAVKAGVNGATKIVTTGHENYAAFIVNESVDEVVTAITEASQK